MAAEEVANFINSGSGRSLPAFKFTNIGDTVVGTVLRCFTRDVRSYSNPGEKEKQLLIELKTDQVYSQPGTDRLTGQPIVNTGDEWAIWIKSPSQMLTALAEQLRANQAGSGAPFEGDRLGITFESTEASRTAGFAPKKVYTVLYKKGVAAAATTAGGVVTIDQL